ncbi:MAG: hypothetical protein QOK20_1307 [Acidimicrobiaceae bacterium]|nr:hypothetical protein [Acidimicrobiaceae bacterium]
MTNPQREKAEAVIGHVQQAASEMIAAAHDALDLVDQVVATAGLGAVLDTFNRVSQSLFGRTRPPSDRTSPAPDDTPAPSPRPASTVQRIIVG